MSKQTTRKVSARHAAEIHAGVERIYEEGKERERVMSDKRSKESVAVYMTLMGMKAAGRIEEDAAEQLDQIMEEAFSALEAKLSKMEEAKIRVGIDDEYVHGSVFHMERMDSDHIWFRIGEQAFDLYAKRRGKLLWIPQTPNGSWEALAGGEEEA